jgi:diaminohydroxyphosphoribosylaminopyrimidine deaminase/5-amino-6-(5-phosphoribosylamino)uracil reductase
MDGRTALANGKSLWITSESARLDVQIWRAQSCAVMTGIGTLLTDDPSMNVRLDGASRQPLRIIVDSHLQTPLDCKMLNANLLDKSPVLIAYADDVNNKASLLTAAGVQLLHLPDQNGRVNLPDLLSILASRGVNEVLLEAGQGLNGAFLQAGLIDEFIFYFAPKLMGADAKSMFNIPELTEMQQATNLQILDVRQIEHDIRLRAKPAKYNA